MSYYLVGFVTCLEWHARTRLADLYTFRPDVIDKKTLDGKVSPETLAQMIRANVTIPHLLSASTTVSSVDDYVGSLQRVFDALGVEQSVARLIQPQQPERLSLFGEPIREPSVRDILAELFEARHALVHEIGIGGGAWSSVGANWSVQDVLRTGHVVLATMRAYERALTEAAPAGFPNLLDATYMPQDEVAVLRERARLSSARIAARIQALSTLRDVGDIKAWEGVVSRQDALLDFLSTSPLLQRRGRPRRTLAKLELMQRLTVLEALEAELADPDDNP